MILRGHLLDQWGKHLQGGELEGWLAPEITANNRQGIGAWSDDELVRYLKTAANDKTVAAGPMAEALDNSLQHLNNSDLSAIADYLNAQPGSEDKFTTVKRCSGYDGPW